ncbi:hypothetical protein FACS1894137_03940 [Spirochaetia bacterium]|nr:hypothetical protein FACS1894137_03940 [Spirochaetia bacterium]
MKLITLLAVIPLIFVSCGSGPAPAGSGSVAPAGSSAAAEKGASTAKKIPVEKRAVVKFADGSLDEYTVSEYDPSDITLLFQNRFSASKSLMGETEFTYNEEKRMLDTKTLKDDEKRLKTRVVYEYKDTRTDEPTKETVVNKAGKKIAINVYTYNDAGKVASRSIQNGNGVDLAKTAYTYSGDLLVSSETNDRNGKRISSSVNTYNADGLLESQEFRNSAGAVTRKITTKWQNGLEIEVTQTSPDGKLQLKITNEYGASGEVLKRIVENYQGKSTQIKEFEYEYRPARGRT